MLTSSLWLVVALIPRSVVSSFPLLVVGGWLVGMIFYVQTLVPTILVKLGWGLEQLALVVHSIFVELGVPQMWASIPNIVVSSK